MQYIVLDPSCSGSGIVSRMDNFTGQAEDECKKEVRVCKLGTGGLSNCTSLFLG